jgi:hypothetical protein
VKYLILITAFICAGPALAISEYTGKTPDGIWVTVQVTTTGATGTASEGNVVIEKDENKFGYHFNHDDITQYFENDDSANNLAMVGVAAYVAKESPVSVKYYGPNFVDMDLKTVIQEGKAGEVKNNFMRVWKGPGYDANNQYQLTDIVCSDWANL